MSGRTRSTMRILWIGPWGRPLARVFLDEVVRTGHDAMLVTSAGHYEQWDRPAGYEFMVTGAVKQPAGWASAARALAAVRRFRPDVVVAEEFGDARYLPLLSATRAPHATLVHDDAPHDDSEIQAWYHKRVYLRVRRTSGLLITFSDFIGDSLRAKQALPVVTLGLPSDAGEHHVPPFVAAAGRRDVVLIGRIGPYKNLAATFAAWAEHVGSPAYRGDRLLVVGDGPHDPVALPPACEWRREHFQFAELMPVVARAKASLAYYTYATQSGVQVLSMQCGTTALVSDVGGLPEYLPDTEKPIPLGEPSALAAALGVLADPAVAVARGRVARDRYEARHHPRAAADALLAALDRLRSGGCARAGARR